MKCPDVYGNLFRITIARSARWTTSRSSSSPSTAVQKTHPCSSSADLMYSRRQGAQSRSTGLVVQWLGLHRLGLGGDPHHREPGKRSEHSGDEGEGGGEQERLPRRGRTVGPRCRTRA